MASLNLPLPLHNSISVIECLLVKLISIFKDFSQPERHERKKNLIQTLAVGANLKLSKPGPSLNIFDS